jgi:drug/metabolite transporter (DMT)-like permease
LFGVSTPLAKLLLGQIPPVLMAGLLYLGAGFGLAAWIFYRRMRPSQAHGEQERLHRSDLRSLIGAIVFGGILGPVLLMLGLARTAASTASLLLNLEGVFTALVAWFVFREHFDRRILAGMAAITAGAAWLSWAGRPEAGIPWGALAIAAACGCWAIDNNLTRRISTANPILVAAIKCSMAGTVNIAIAAALGARLPDFLSVLTAAGVGLLGYGVSLVLFIQALREVGTARTTAYFSTAPFFGTVASIVILRDPITAGLLVAGGLMALGVWLHVTERHKHLHVHREMTHTHWHVHDEHHQHAHEYPVAPGTSHSHEHKHERLEHAHTHYPDIHHRHAH